MRGWSGMIYRLYLRYSALYSIFLPRKVSYEGTLHSNMCKTSY